MTRILIGALSGWKYHERRQCCLSTWMGDADRLGTYSFFLLGCPTAARPEQIGLHAVALPCPDDYPSLPRRTLWFCRWACEPQYPDWDYLFKCDDDTYVSMPRLLSYDLARPRPRPGYWVPRWVPRITSARSGGRAWATAAAGPATS